MNKIVVFLFLLPTFAVAQLSKQDSVWIPITNLLGTWRGTSEGQPGKGTYERTYRLVLNKKFVEVKNKSTYAPSVDNPKGEVHEDHGFISYDKVRKTFVLRQFHIEGFVNQYTLESISEEGKKLVFLSESIENIPKGYRARETYHLINENEFIETFELAEPGKEFEVYSKATLRRQQ